VIVLRIDPPMSSHERQDRRPCSGGAVGLFRGVVGGGPNHREQQ